MATPSAPLEALGLINKQDGSVMLFEVAVLVVAALAGAFAAVTGFGIGSLLTPLLALRSKHEWPWQPSQSLMSSVQRCGSGYCLEVLIERCSGASG